MEKRIKQIPLVITEIDELSAIKIPEKAHLIYIEFPNDGFIELRQIFVSENEREKGYGKVLIDKLKEIAVKKSFKSILVASDATDEQVFGKFLKSMGFNKTNMLPFFWELKLRNI